LIFCLAIFVITLAASLVFASAFHEVPARASDPALCGDPAPQTDSVNETHKHDAHAKAEAKPPYYIGGLWSPEHGLAPLLDAAMLLATKDRPIVCQSINFNADTLTVIDRSPIRFEASNFAADTKPDLILSIDLAGRVPSTEYAGIGPIQQYITDEKKNYNTVLIVEPLPGPVPDPDEDWSILNFDGDESVTFYTPDRKESPEEVALAIFKQLGGTASASSNIAKLIEQLGSTDTNASINACLQLATMNPYEVVPALDKWLAAANDQSREPRIFESLMVRRGLGVHADALIAQAAASENAQLRALAARAVGDLADLTTDPIGKLTLLAEDDAMPVRYEALVAAHAIPGRRAAGVAELVEPYEMSDAMRATYQGIMADLLTYGQPIAADSKANRLRRMAINELLKEERGALVCAILLERTDLPDDKITEAIGQLAKATNKPTLTAFINLLAGMNPKTLSNRDPLLKALVAWDRAEVRQHISQIHDLTDPDLLPKLRYAAAAMLIKNLPKDAAISSVGRRGVTFYKAFEWINDPKIIADWKTDIIEGALVRDPLTGRSAMAQIAGLDAIKLLPADSLEKATIDRLVKLARTDNDIDVRFAAMRAINALPASQQPDAIEDLQLTTLTIASVPGQMKYDKDKLTVTAGRPVELTLTNPDTMEHNLVATQPGRAQQIGIAMSADPTAAAAIGYVPENDPAVLHHTKMIPAGGSDTLRFIAPTKPGQYEYVCTFPGHYTSMRGVLEVVAP
jgi:azurin